MVFLPERMEYLRANSSSVLDISRTRNVYSTSRYEFKGSISHGDTLSYVDNTTSCNRSFWSIIPLNIMLEHHQYIFDIMNKIKCNDLQNKNYMSKWKKSQIKPFMFTTWSLATVLERNPRCLEKCTCGKVKRRYILPLLKRKKGREVGKKENIFLHPTR